MLHDLLETVPQIGKLEWIGLAATAGAEIVAVESAELVVGEGLVGDHHSTHKPGGKRQVTLIQAEHLPVVAALCGLDSIGPERLRRNLLVSGINLLSLKKQIFQIGTAIFEGTGPCEPCSLMEKTLGEGGYQAMRGHGGITARVLQAGRISIGDAVHTIPAEAAN